jgi:hypothetical protein
VDFCVKVLETLQGGMTMLFEEGEEDYEKVINRILCPKAITMGQLFGQFDPVSHEVSCMVQRLQMISWLFFFFIFFLTYLCYFFLLYSFQ